MIPDVKIKQNPSGYAFRWWGQVAYQSIRDLIAITIASFSTLYLNFIRYDRQKSLITERDASNVICGVSQNQNKKSYGNMPIAYDNNWSNVSRIRITPVKRLLGEERASESVSPARAEGWEGTFNRLVHGTLLAGH